MAYESVYSKSQVLSSSRRLRLRFVGRHSPNRIQVEDTYREPDPEPIYLLSSFRTPDS